MINNEPRGTNVVPFRSLTFQATSQNVQRMRSVTCAETLQKYWEDLRQDGQIPYRRDIRADALIGNLKNLILFDKISSSEVRIRLQGNSITTLFRQDLTGLPLSAILSPDGRLAFADVIEDMYSKGRPLVMHLEERGFSFGKKLRATLVLYPLLDQLGRPTKGIGYFDLDGVVKAKEYQFDISSISQHKQNIVRFS